MMVRSRRLAESGRCTRTGGGDGALGGGGLGGGLALSSVAELDAGDGERLWCKKARLHTHTYTQDTYISYTTHTYIQHTHTQHDTTHTHHITHTTHHTHTTPHHVTHTQHNTSHTHKENTH